MPHLLVASPPRVNLLAVLLLTLAGCTRLGYPPSRGGRRDHDRNQTHGLG